MNRHQRRQREHDIRKQQKELRRTLGAILPDTLQLVPKEDMPSHPNAPMLAWRSKKFIVQLFGEDKMMPGLARLSISKAKFVSGNWADGITWDELQQIKREVGLGDYYAIEVYPRDKDLVNVANMRHLWVCKEPLQIGWFEE